MGLIERLIGEGVPHNPAPGQERIPAHDFDGVLAEIDRGNMTLAQAATKFNLSAAEQTELSNLIAKIVGDYDSVALGGFQTLTNIGTAYDAINASKGLGSVELQVAGIEWFRFGVFVSKVGTGTQSWQLWNVTDALEVAVIDDAGAAGDKTLSVTVTPGTPYAPAIKQLRVRAKSTVAADDPIYYGASIVFRRRARLLSRDVHGLLMMASNQVPPLTSAAALRTRLGI